MKKTTALLCSLFLVSHNANAQNISLEDERLVDANACSGIMNTEELVTAAKSLSAKNNENSDFFATNCLMLAAHKGHMDAQYELSQAYEQGTGIPASNVYAYKWAKISEFNGKEIAPEKLTELENKMSTKDLQQATREITSYINFEQKLTTSRDKNFLQDIITTNNYDISPEKMEQIETISREIDQLFNHNFTNPDTIFNDLGTATPVLMRLNSKQPAQPMNNTQGTASRQDSANRQPAFYQNENSDFDNQRQIEEERMMQEMEQRDRQRQDEERRLREQENDRQRQDEERMMQEMERSNDRGSSSSSNASSSKSIDFFTDTYNPKFNPPN